MEIVEKHHGLLFYNLNHILDDSKIEFSEKIHLLFKKALEMHKKSEVFIKDLKRNEPKVWEYFMDLRSKSFPITMEKLIREGIKKGKIRPDINIKITIMIFDACIENLAINPNSELENHSRDEITEEIQKTIFMGILKR